jgi:hypothetical protein
MLGFFSTTIPGQWAWIIFLMKIYHPRSEKKRVVKAKNQIRKMMLEMQEWPRLDLSFK